MHQEVTEKSFYQQLSGSVAGAITATGIGTAIVGFCAIFCATQLGILNLLSIVLLLALIACIVLLVRFILKAAHLKQHPVFDRYGPAGLLASKISDGMLNPRYLAKGFDSNQPFATLMTDEFIVNGVELVSYMELKDFCKVHAGAYAIQHRIVVGDPLLTATSVAANYVGDKVLESKGINSQTQFDFLVFENAAGKSTNMVSSIRIWSAYFAFWKRSRRISSLFSKRSVRNPYEPICR